MQEAEQRCEQRLGVGARECVLEKVRVAMQQQVQQQRGARLGQRRRERVVQLLERYAARAQLASFGVVGVVGVVGVLVKGLLIAERAQRVEERVARQRPLCEECGRKVLSEEQQQVKRPVGERERPCACVGVGGRKDVVDVARDGAHRVVREQQHRPDRAADRAQDPAGRGGRHRAFDDVGEQPLYEQLCVRATRAEHGKKERLRRGHGQVGVQLRAHAHE